VKSIASLVTIPAVADAMDSFAKHQEKIVNLAIAVQQIPAPTGDEGKRARFVRDNFKQLGLKNISVDQIFNVYGCIEGRNPHLLPIIVSAHSDTVFPHETDLRVRREGNLVYGAGIADNSMGVAGLLTLAGTMQRYQLQPERTVWFVCNVGEEGLGDLLGMRAVTDRFGKAHGYIVLEGGMYSFILHEGIGVRRYEVRVDAAGGHSWSDFGRSNAIHILSHVITQIDKIRVPKSPKSTYNVGIIEGGTSINTIAPTATFQLDLRSEDLNGLNQLIGHFEAIINKMRRRYGDVTLQTKVIGDRPTGQVSAREPLVRMAEEALRAVGCRKVQYLRGSTDANIPLSRGYPAVCIGIVHSANAHRLDEYLDTTELTRGMQQILLLVLGSAEFDVF
jgi:acetylornithine deacetylase/succinyl-diaminopimelate desuccinylase-like protein